MNPGCPKHRSVTVVKNGMREVCMAMALKGPRRGRLKNEVGLSKAASSPHSEVTRG